MTKIPYLKEILKWSFDFQGKTHTHTPFKITILHVSIRVMSNKKWVISDDPCLEDHPRKGGYVGLITMAPKLFQNA